MASFVIEEVDGIEIAHKVKYRKPWRRWNGGRVQYVNAGSKNEARLGCNGNISIFGYFAKDKQGLPHYGKLVLSPRFAETEDIPRLKDAPWDASRATQEERIMYVLGNGKNLPEPSDRLRATSPCAKCFREKAHKVTCPTCGHTKMEAIA